MNVHLINVAEDEGAAVMEKHEMSPCGICGMPPTDVFIMALPGEREWGKGLGGVCLCEEHAREYLRDLAAVQPPSHFAI